MTILYVNSIQACLYRESGMRIVRVPRAAMRSVGCRYIVEPRWRTACAVLAVIEALREDVNELVGGNPSPQVSCALRFRFADCLDDGYGRSVCSEFSTSAARCLSGGQRGSSHGRGLVEGKGNRRSGGDRRGARVACA